MDRFNKRDLFAGMVIVFLLGTLAGQQLGARRRDQASTSPAATGQPEARPAAANGADVMQRSGDLFARVAAQVTPAVVNISSTRVTRGRVYRDPMAEWFFGDGRMRTPDQTSKSLGSGVLVDPDGIVVTNNHNIASAGADKVDVRVTLADNREFAARVVGADPESDLAVLKIDAKGLPFVGWGDSQGLRVGEWVLAIGNPFGFSQTVTAGIVSAKGRHELGLSEFEEFIQTDAAINPGNSGGAMIDTDGKLVGINTAIFSETGGYQGIGFAIPAAIAKANAEQLLTRGKVVRGWIGALAKPLNPANARRLGLRNADGAVVTRMYENQPAVKAGLRPLDVVVGVGAKAIKSPGELRAMIAGAAPGSTVTLHIVREGAVTSLKCAVVERPVSPDGEPIPGI